jgi:hypothetical protein
MCFAQLTVFSVVDPMIRAWLTLQMGVESSYGKLTTLMHLKHPKWEY